MLLFLSCVLRVAVISTAGYEQIASNQSNYRIDVARLRGTIYDCNMVPLTNNDTRLVAAVAPTPQAIMQISHKLESDILSDVLDTLKDNLPAVCIVDDEITASGIATDKIYTRDTSNALACHLIGYTDSTGHGVTGLEHAYDDLLYSEKTVSAVFMTDGKGKVLKGIDPYFDNDLSIVYSGVVTTIDINIQEITENALSKLESGCAIVAEASTGKIRAIASAPTFDISNIADSLNANNSPMINRALRPFNVGSVFKPAVAAVAIENNLNCIFDCKGSTKIGDRIFKCHKLSGHGEMSLSSSLAQSCNCYFYNIALELGSASIYKMANSLSLSMGIRLADNFYATTGNLPKLNSLESKGALANFSIGQGSLMASPVAMLNLYTAIANNGCYYIPSVVEKTIKDGTESQYDIGNPTRIMGEKTADTLRKYLQEVIIDGTGKEATPQNVSAAGKTATAQTGRRDENGVEITNSWFCGFFPAQTPKYVVVVMSDSKVKISTARIFAEITDGIVERCSKYVNFND